MISDKNCQKKRVFGISARIVYKRNRFVYNPKNRGIYAPISLINEKKSPVGQTTLFLGVS